MTFKFSVQLSLKYNYKTEVLWHLSLKFNSHLVEYIYTYSSEWGLKKIKIIHLHTQKNKNKNYSFTHSESYVSIWHNELDCDLDIDPLTYINYP